MGRLGAPATLPGGNAVNMGLAVRALAGCLVLALLLPSPALAQGEPPNWPEYTALPFRPGLFWTDVGLSVVYDTNFELTQQALEGPGLLADVRAQFRTNTYRAFARVEYRGEVRQFKASERWNRDTHILQAVLEQRFGPLGIEGIGTWQLSSQTEDKEFADVYSISPRLTLRLGDARLRAYGRFWTRRFEQGQGREETIRTAGGDLGWRVLGFMDWQVGGRYEEAESDSPYLQWVRLSLLATCRLDVGAHTALTLEAARAHRTYPERGIEVAGRVVPIEEARWVPAVYLQMGAWQGPQLRIGYEYEARTSNDARRELEAHRAILGLRVPVLNWNGRSAP